MTVQDIMSELLILQGFIVKTPFTLRTSNSDPWKVWHSNYKHFFENNLEGDNLIGTLCNVYAEVRINFVDKFSHYHKSYINKVLRLAIMKRSQPKNIANIPRDPKCISCYKKPPDRSPWQQIFRCCEY